MSIFSFVPGVNKLAKIIKYFFMPFNSIEKYYLEKLIYNFWQMHSLQKQLDYAFDLVSKPDNFSIKQGETHLNRLKANIEYPILLLQYMKDSLTYQGKLRAAIQLRIWCDNYKNMQQFQRNAFNGVIQDIKTNILFAFLTFTDKIEKTLLPGIVSLTVVQFPDRWTNLIPQLIQYLSQNPDTTLKSLQLVAEITNKYSYLSRSDPLYHEIIQVCNQFQGFLLKLTKYSLDNILMNQNNPGQLKILQQQMVLFYNLNYQDLHPQFEDNLQQWMDILNKVMKLPNNNQNFFKCKGAALQSILLYASKYKDDVQQSIKGFMEQIWNLCANASQDSQYDDIVTNALKYFKSLLLWQDMKPNFASNIQNLISNLILPNLNLTQQYKDLFHEDIETFISYFFRNSETLSRRSNAIQLLQSIVRHFNQQFSAFIQDQVKGFIPNQNNINMQCLLLTLVIQSAPKGFRDLDGVIGLQINQNIIIFCYENFVKSTLGNIYQCFNSNPTKPVEKQINIHQLLTTLRYIFYFRIFLPKQDLNSILELCSGMCCQNDSLKQIIILVVHALVTIKHGNYLNYSNIVYYYDENRLKDVASRVFTMICVYENEYDQLNTALNRLLFATIKQLKQYNQLFYDSHINGLLNSIFRKTSNFTFVSILPFFESVGYLAFYLSSMNSNKSRQLEEVLHQYFHQMITQRSDNLNFCFQILSIFLRFNSSKLPFYENLYGSVIRPENWTQDNLSLVSSYLQYIGSYISQKNVKMVEDKPFYEQILTRLIQLDHFQLFFRFLRIILKISNVEGFYQAGYFQILVQGIKFISGRNLEGRKMSLQFLFEISFDYNTNFVINCLNSIQNGFYQTFILSNQDIIRTMQVLRNRKIMFGSVCNALTLRIFNTPESQALIISLLTENTIGRFRRQNFLSNNQHVVKKQSTYQKLSVFKEIEQGNQAVSLDQENALVEAYRVCVNNNPNLNSFLNQKVLNHIKKLYERQSR